ncbi:EF-hand domain-containing family member B [Coccinella septempunctata]|uniref:EF-hand domain-containing family member B n=1 Tax=Coccinella septempunctata TaxID=41139 RepID=UPI001D090383|nr:EF-hand domain-containing family member B [Coccinella septempunctata]
MANLGKYKDNFSFICAAGVWNKPNFSAGDCLKRYTLEDEVQALKADFHVPKKEYKPTKLPKVAATNRNPGIFLESRELLNPPPLTRYRQLVNDLKETTYASYWNKQLGATPDSTPTFPEGMKVDEITFGDPYKYDCSVKDLIQPPKTPYQVLWDSQINHDAYKKVYGSYNPSEQINRGYVSPPFCPTQTFGKKCGYDKRGLKAKCCLEWYNNSPVTIVSGIQKNWMEKNQRKLGKCYEPNQILEILPEGHTFGAPYRREMYGVEELLKEPNTPISTSARDIRIWLVSFNRLKMAIEKKITPTFDYNILYERLKFFDRDGSGRITFGHLLEVMRCHEIFFNIKNVKALMEYLGIVVENIVDYQKFMDALKGHLSLGKIRIPGNDTHFLSTYQASCCDLLIPDENVCRRDAGIPTHRLDERKPANPYTDKYVELSDFTNMKACLQPSIFTQYSLSHRDFLCPRDKDFIRSLFRKIGYELSDQNFEEIWKIGLGRDGSGGVCVQTFRDLMNEYFPLQRKLNVDGVAT